MTRLRLSKIAALLLAAQAVGAQAEKAAPASPAAAERPRAEEVVVTVIVPEGSQGPVIVALMASKDDYQDWAARYGGQAEPVDGVARVAFADVPYGEYLATAFQDRNRNQFLDTNDLKMPQEPYGFSRNAFGLFGTPPRWDKGAFAVDAPELGIELTLRDRGERLSGDESVSAKDPDGD
ncbi:MAG: DUF2141 domain-containing protein [Opitutales bacterium]